MKKLTLALMFLATPMFAADAPRLVSRVLCAGADCELPQRLGARVAPTLASQATAGTLLVEEKDPLRECIGSGNSHAASSCVARVLAENAEAIANELTAKGYDGYLILTLDKSEKQVAGGAILATTGREVITTTVRICSDHRGRCSDTLEPQGGYLLTTGLPAMADERGFKGLVGAEPDMVPSRSGALVPKFRISFPLSE
ncbi:MAG TPA: hypothetical protein VGF69_19195 [Thermoanaerobaculia bacterium]|jgi:hypothetical protein